jgi:hypothetical protein
VRFKLLGLTSDGSRLKLLPHPGHLPMVLPYGNGELVTELIDRFNLYQENTHP